MQRNNGLRCELCYFSLVKSGHVTCHKHLEAYMHNVYICNRFFTRQMFDLSFSRLSYPQWSLFAIVEFKEST